MKDPKATEDGDRPVRQRPGWGRALRSLAALAAGLVVIGGVELWSFDRAATRELQAELDRLRLAGQPIHRADLVVGDCDGGRVGAWREAAGRLEPTLRYREFQVALGGVDAEGELPGAWTDDLERLGAFVEDNAEAAAAIDRMTRPALGPIGVDCRLDPGVALELIDAIEDSVYLLEREAVFRFRTGEFVRVSECLVGLVGCARTLEALPLLRAQDDRLAILEVALRLLRVTIEAGRLDPAEAAVWMDRLDRLGWAELMVPALVYSRSEVIDAALGDATARDLSESEVGLVARLVVRALPALQKADLVEFLRLLGPVLVDFERPYPDLVDRFTRLDRQFRDLPFYCVWTRTFFPAVGWLRWRIADVRTRAEMGRSACALLVAAGRSGSLPPGWSSLLEIHLLAACPIDRVTGRPLILVVEGQRAVISARRSPDEGRVPPPWIVGISR